MFKAVWAQDKNGLIGKDLKIPWYLPNDLKFFKEETMGTAVVMGRKTFEGMDFKALPKRENIIITRQVDKFKNQDFPDNVIFTDDIQAIVERGKTEDISIIGGEEIFKAFWPVIDELRVTHVEGDFEGDTYFQADLSDFELYKTVDGATDEKNIYPHQFYYYHRKKG